MIVIKRDGTKENFDINKIQRVVNSAFSATGKVVPEYLVRMINSLFTQIDGDTIGVEEIQDKIENILMNDKFFDVAKSYILYRHAHAESRLIKEKVEYITKYSKSKENAAANSNTDANANNSCKNVSSVEIEVFKDKNRLIQRMFMKNMLHRMYPEVEDNYLEDIMNHIIYPHDEGSSPIQKPYCGAYVLYPLMTEGVGNVDNITPSAPNDMQSFSGQATNLVFALSAQSKGAVALGDYFVTLNYYVVQEFGPQWYNKVDEVFANSNVVGCHKYTIGREIKKSMKQFVYGVNQPQGNRGFQSPFTNLSIYDKFYYEALFDGYAYPDGTKPEWAAIDKLQRMFIALMRELRAIKPLTFPVLTVALLHNAVGYMDKEYADLCAEEWALGSSHFLYNSSNPESLSSCCFSPETKVLWKSSTLGVQCTSLQELEEMKWEPNKKNLRIFHNGFWINGHPIKTTNTNLYRVETANHKVFYMTDNHINVTSNGEKKTKDLTTDDYLMFNTNSLNAIPENDEHLTYEQGFAVGAFLGDGCFSKRYKDGTIYDVMYSQNINKYKICMENVTKANYQLGQEGECKLKEVHNNVYPIRISSKELVAFIQKWTNWNEGTYSYNKELNLDCLLQSIEFRKGILDGWYNTDGGNSNRCYTTSEKLKDCMEILITSLGMNSIIDKSDRTDESVIIRGQEYDRNYPLWCVRWYEPCNKNSMKDIYKWKNNSQYFKIVSIEHMGESPLDKYSYCIECNDKDNPYFTLPSGLVTHNCRVQNKLTENYFTSTTGMIGLMTGSCNVITLNLNRIIQDWYNTLSEREALRLASDHVENDYSSLKVYLSDILERVYKYHIAYKTMLYELEEQGMITYSNAGYLYIKKLYSTIGVIGYYEAAKFLGLEDNSEEYKEFINFIMSVIDEQNTAHSVYDRKKPYIFNLEAIPGENLAVKLYNWDKNDGYWVPEDQNLYNCYFYNPWKDGLSVIDKLKLHGRDVCKSLGGGQAAHINLDTHASKEQYLLLMDVARIVGCNYFTFNIPMSECKDCGHVVNGPIIECPICHSHNIEYWTRVIGFLTAVGNWSPERQKEYYMRVFGHDLGLKQWEIKQKTLC